MLNRNEYTGRSATGLDGAGARSTFGAPQQSYLRSFGSKCSFWRK